MTTVRHPIFARVYRRLSEFTEVAVTQHRDELLAELAGQVVEVGCGNGMNFAHYPRSVDEVIAVEPEPYLRGVAEGNARTAPVPVIVVDGTADHLPLEGASCDAVVFSLVLCSVADQAAALAEAKRVLRPGGEVRFYEHVIGASPRMARAQRAVDPVWPRLFGGCHCNRDTPAGIESAGFEIERIRRFDIETGPLPLPVTPHALGRARISGV